VHVNPRRRGSALLDVVISLVVLGLSGLGLISLLGQGAHSVRSVRNTERDVRRASDELGRFVMYDRARLIAMVGRSWSAGWRIEVVQASRDLFDVSVGQSDASSALLRTTVYRPDTIDAASP
jgi:Tfp pilus assembly protein PilV